MSTTQACPVVGTTNSTLPPSHPDVDLSRPGQTCPVVGAKTEHHGNLHKHPSVPNNPITQSTGSSDAQACPALKTVVNEAKSKEMDDVVCPVAGPVTAVLPPDHPSIMQGKADEAECPVTKAKIGHHKDKVIGHPNMNVASGVCPVTGVKQA